MWKELQSQFALGTCGSLEATFDLSDRVLEHVFLAHFPGQHVLVPVIFELSPLVADR
jgi:hypothetical protein